MSKRIFISLLFKLTRVQTEIEQEMQRPLPNSLKLLKLKKLRLMIKDRMQHLMRNRRKPKLRRRRLQTKNA